MIKPLIAAFIAMILSCPINMLAQNFHLSKDIDTSKNGSPANFVDNSFIRLNPDYNYDKSNFNSDKYAVLNGIAYFAADDGVHGVELWRSDSITNGTYIPLRALRTVFTQ